MANTGRRTTAEWFWLGIFISAGLAFMIGLLTYTGAAQWPVVCMSILGALAFSAAALYLHLFNASFGVGKPLKIIVVLAIIWGSMGFLGWKVWPPSGPTSGFRVNFRTQFIDIEKEPNPYQMFGFLAPWGFGQQLSPIALVSYLNIRSYYRKPVSITSYAMAIKTPSCGWTYLSPLSTFTGRVLVLHPPQSPVKEDEMVDTSNALDDFSVTPTMVREGTLFFATKVSCPTQVGDPVKLRLEITDSEDNKTSYESPDLSIRTDATPGKTVADTTNFSLAMTGEILDTTKVVRRSITDAPPAHMDMDALKNNQATLIRTISPFSLVFPDGTYSSVRPKAP